MALIIQLKFLKMHIYNIAKYYNMKKYFGNQKNQFIFFKKNLNISKKIWPFF